MNLFKELVDIGQRETADLCFQELLLPLLSDEKAFKELKYNNGNDSLFNRSRPSNLSFIDTILYLLDTLILVKNEATEDQISQLFTMISSKFDPDELKALITKLKPQFGTFKMYKPIVRLFEDRVNLLKDKAAKEPVFSWKMRGSTGDSTVDRFLESDKQSITYCNFSDIKQARRFVRHYSGLKHNYYSVSMCECGRGKSSGVQITKTRELYESQMRHVNEIRSE